MPGDMCTTPRIAYERQLIFLPYVRLINSSFHFFRSSASFFSSQYLLFFLKLPRSCVLFFPYSFHFRHLSFNGIMKNMANPIGFLRRMLFKCLILSYYVQGLLLSLTSISYFVKYHFIIV
jgi:hypothetical protein